MLFGIGNAAIQDRPHDEEVPEPHHRLADHRNKRCVGDEPAEQGAPRHAAALGVVIGIDGDDARDARIAPGGDDQSDRSADRDAGKRHVTQIEPVEKAFDRFGEEGRVVARLGNVRIAVPRIVQSVDGKVLGELGDDLFEQVQLRSQRVQQNEVGTFAGLDVAELLPPTSTCSMGRSGAQRSFCGSRGTGRSASTTKENSHTPMPTPIKIKRADSAVLIA